MATRIPLNPLDCVTAVMDDALRHAGMPGANCAQVTVLGGRVDPERLRRAVEVLGARHVVTTARLHRPWWAWWPSWDLTSPSPIPVVVEDADDPISFVLSLLHEPTDLRVDPPVKIALLRRSSGGDVLVVRWPHVLTDGRGMRFLVRELGRCYAGEYAVDGAPAPLRPAPITVPVPAGFRPPRNGKQDALFQIMRAGETGHLCLSVTDMDEAQSERVRQNATRIAGAGQLPVFLIAAYLRTLRRECLRAGRTDAVLRIWWPFALREGRLPGGLPGNEFGTLRAECRAEDPGDLAALVERLKQDIASQLAAGEHCYNWRVGRWMKVGFFPFVCLVSRRTGFLMRGKRLTTQFQFSGRIVGPDRAWGGIPIAGGFLAAILSRHNPVSLNMSEIAGRFNLVLTWRDGAIGDETRQRLIDTFRDELLCEG